MKTLVIHDNTGYVLSTISGEPSPREPIGVPFLWVDIPEGKRIKITDGIGVDVYVTPHKVILEDIPPTETELLGIRVKQQEDALFELAELLSEVIG
ncbi:hypothetical protein [Bacillus sp. FJAT-49736]|uniref:hypothetical protein n=1 Tax=Bacillus sp. FJAT-49736 TaxID=2833582 RepID=UPI001BC99D7F|nr:hypothetical protein [Bacillus sp. FJAT-49736]MBS4171949.1 hypothetical protein [Bacillus sp. FJAT-49736]